MADIFKIFGDDGKAVWQFATDGGPSSVWEVYNGLETNNADMTTKITSLETDVGTAIGGVGASVGPAIQAAKENIKGGATLTDLNDYLSTNHHMQMTIVREFQDRLEDISAKIHAIEGKLGDYTPAPGRDYTGPTSVDLSAWN